MLQASLLPNLDQRDIWVYLLLAIGALLVVLLMMWRKQQNRPLPRENKSTPLESLGRGGQTPAMKQELRDLMTEIEQLSERVSTRLEQQCARAEQLLRQLEARSAEPSSSTAVSPSKSPKPAPPPPPPESSELTESEAVHEEDQDAPPATEPLDPLARAVYELADAGRSPEQIANHLHEHIGKIELILALRQVRGG